MFRLLTVIALVGGISFGLVTGRPQEKLSDTTRSNGRIVGGILTKIDYFPHQISLQSDGRHICGGSLINRATVLTAGHCTHGFNISSLTIRAGSSYHDRGGQVLNVKKVFQHPLFNGTTPNYDYDVSVLKLPTLIHVGGTTRPIKLPPKNFEVVPGSGAAVSGWGITMEGGFLPSGLQFVRVPIISRSDCGNAYTGKGEITERHICAGYSGIGGKDSCKGDSGGPLIQDGVQIGIVSWGKGCAHPEYPGVYSNIAKLRDFINKH